MFARQGKGYELANPTLDIWENGMLGQLDKTSGLQENCARFPVHLNVSCDAGPSSLPPAKDVKPGC